MQVIRRLVLCSDSLFDPSIISAQSRPGCRCSDLQPNDHGVLLLRRHTFYTEKDEKALEGVEALDHWISLRVCEVRTVQAPQAPVATSRVCGQPIGGLHPWLPESG